MKRAGLGIRSCLVALVAWLPALFPGSAAAQTIILRDLTLIEAVAVEHMNIEGVFLTGGRHYSWDLVLQGEVGAAYQQEFDRWRKTVGELRFRLLQRMKHGDDEALGELASELEKIAEEASEPGETVFLARCAQVRAALAARNPEKGFSPLMELIVQRDDKGKFPAVEQLAGLTFTEDGFCAEQLPFWPDREKARAEWQRSISGPASPELSNNEVVQVYRRTLSIAAGESGPKNLDNVREDDPWNSIYLAQSALLDGNWAVALERLDPELHKDSPARHPIALYYSGLAMLRAEQDGHAVERDGKLVLLSIPALYGTQFAELSAAAIHTVINHPPFAADPECEILRAELAGPYRRTTFGIESR